MKPKTILRQEIMTQEKVILQLEIVAQVIEAEIQLVTGEIHLAEALEVIVEDKTIKKLTTLHIVKKASF